MSTIIRTLPSSYTLTHRPVQQLQSEREAEEQSRRAEEMEVRRRVREEEHRVRQEQDAARKTKG